MGTLWQDIRFGLRMLRKSPGFTTVAVLTLALGIGANLALFGILNEMLLRPKPVSRPDELRAVVPVNTAKQRLHILVYRHYYDAIREKTRFFNDVIGYADVEPKMRTADGLERVQAELVTPGYFPFLGVRAARGRVFGSEEDAEAGGHPVALISDAFWRRQFGGAPDVVGKILILNETPVEIVGVAPKGFGGLGPQPASLWMPANMEPVLEKWAASYETVGRLAEAKAVAAATEYVSSIVAEVTQALLASKPAGLPLRGVYPEFTGVRLDPIGRGLLGTSYDRPKIVSFLQFGMVATVLLLAIACANVAGLFLARALQRRRETATRVALGATRGALMRGVMCEGVLVAAAGTVAALVVYAWVGRGIMSLADWWSGPALRLAPDVRVLVFAAGGALAVGVGFSLVPALQAMRFEPAAALKDGQGAGRQRLWLRHGLIVGQVVGSIVLLCGAMLCLRSMRKQLAVDVGYRYDRLATAQLDLERIGFTEGSFEPQLAEIVRRLRLIPGVEQVGVAGRPPLGGQQVGSLPSDTFVPEGYESPDGCSVDSAIYSRIGPGMFRIMGVPVLRGREFGQEDVDSGRLVVVVNESFAERFWPGQDPVGKHIYKWPVIGVVKDACINGYDDWPGPAVFRCVKKAELLHATLVIRTRGDARRVVGSVRRELGRVHPRLVEGDVRPVRDIVKDALAFQQAALRILGALGVLALVLASVGTYGVMAYVVSSRTREVGIRLAVGATRGDVMRLVLLTGLRLGLVAMAIGLPLALAAAVVLRNRIAGVSPFDPVSFVAVAACVLAALLAACWVPARRAARIDPMVALRYE